MIALAILKFLCGFAVGAPGGRARGSAEMDLGKNFLGRIVYWATPATLVVAAFSGNILLALSSLPLFWLGAAIGYLGGDWDFSKPGNYNIRNYAILGLRGALIMLPFSIYTYALAFFGFLDHGMGLAGVAAGLPFAAYYIAGTYLVKKYRFWLVQEDTNWGEFLLWGAAMGGLAASI